MAKQKNISANKNKAILNFIFEAGLLKRVKRSGWWVLGIDNPESVADHSFRAAFIGYFLAEMEGADSHKVSAMALFADTCEARITDLHKMAQSYFDFPRAEDKAFAQQTEGLPGKIKQNISGLLAEYRAQKTAVSVIARDADILECLIQAKEYFQYGFKEAVKFTKKAPVFLKTKSARRLWKLAKTGDANKWWQDIGEFGR